jgi:riboflavin kinase/FMN adenylyltransferase
VRVVYGVRDLAAGRTVVTVGVFDGVHKGHQALMRTVVEKARELDATPAVLTFDRHPLEVIAPGKEPPLITTLRQRADVYEDVGIELVVVLRFDDALRHLPAEEFVKRYVVDSLRCVHAVVGANFRFGYEGRGTIEMLGELGDRFGFGVTIFALVGEGEQQLSSSLIREQIAAGRVEVVAEELGRPFRLEGVVETGAGRGRGLGIPTANLRVAEKLLLPKVGVYAGWLWWQGRRYQAAINVGYNPTFEDRDRPIVEAHVIEAFDGELYGEVVGVEFTHRLRDELKFPDAGALMEQVRKDIDRARELLTALPGGS